MAPAPSHGRCSQRRFSPLEQMQGVSALCNGGASLLHNMSSNSCSRIAFYCPRKSKSARRAFKRGGP